MLGESAGRSAGNRTGTGANRRNTPRERAGIDPVFPEPPAVRFAEEPRYRLTPRGEKILTVVAWGSWLFFCVLFAVVMCAWWGLL